MLSDVLQCFLSYSEDGDLYRIGDFGFTELKRLLDVGGGIIFLEFS